MKHLLLSILLLLFVSSNALNAQEIALPENLEQYFDFWLGKWDASWDEGDGKQGKGTNHITKIMDGKVVQEDFRILSGKSKGFKGGSLSVYQVRKKQWKQAWADSQGGYFDFTGKFDGNKRIFQTTPDSTGFTQRMVFYDIQENQFTWDWEASKDGGKTWKLNWRIFYVRAEK